MVGTALSDYIGFLKTVLHSLNAPGLILHLAVQFQGIGKITMTVFYFMSHTILCTASLSSSSDSIRQLEQKYVSSSFGHAWLSGVKTGDMVQITVNYPPIFFLF